MPEMSILGILFFLEALFCLFCFFSEYRRHSLLPNLPSFFSMTSDVIFWIFITIWSIYEGILRTVYFPYDESTLNFFYLGFIAIVYLIPLSSLIMMISELLIDYRGFSRRLLILFRIIFGMFFSTFLILGVGLSLVDWGDPGNSMSLWHGCTDLIIAVFVGAPAFALIRIVSFPTVPTENERCVSITKVLTVFFCGIMLLRGVYNITHGLNVNPADQWFATEAAKPGKVSWKARLFQAVWVFFFDFCSSMAVIIGVKIWRQNDVKFADKKFFRAELGSTPDGE
jgi:hypothetical protein